MYLRLGSLSYWPIRSVFIQNMPSVYKEEFPNCVAIIDCTEIEKQRPSSLLCQSQCYSEYKSATTLKSLVVCDPRCSILIVSDLYCGSISDNDICVKRGFFQHLQSLMERGYLHPGDSIMADKGFRMEDQLAEIGQMLNITPFASSAQSISAANVTLRRKIAAHRILFREQ